MTSHKSLYLLVLAIAFLPGCHKTAKKITPEKPSEPIVVVVPEYLKPSVEAAGGQNAWAETQVITGDCVVRIFSDSNSYVTQLKIAVYPWSDTIRIAAFEPQGKFVWELFRDNYRLIQGQWSWANQMPVVLRDRFTTEALWSLLAPPARLATSALDRDKPAQPVLIDGLWYYPIRITGPRVYYLNRSSNMVTMCLIPTADNRFILARGYNYRSVVDTMINLPYKIEIFESDSLGTPRKLLISYDFTQIRTLRF
jgi:hypothetical protein